MDILLMFSGFILMCLVVLLYEYRIRLLGKQRNKVHFYVARDKNGELWLYMGKPNRDKNTFCSPLSIVFTLPCHLFDCLGINKKDYANLKWEDEPVEVFVNMED